MVVTRPTAAAVETTLVHGLLAIDPERRGLTGLGIGLSHLRLATAIRRHAR